MTQKGCSGQFSACSQKNKEPKDAKNIYSKKGEGSCVFLSNNIASSTRATQCSIRLNLACQGKIDLPDKSLATLKVPAAKKVVFQNYL